MRSILLLFVSLLIISCNSDKKKTEITTESTTSTKKAITADDGVANIVVKTNDMMKFNTKKITVKAGQKVILTLKHLGSLDKKIMGHNIVILNKGVDMAAFAAKAVAAKENDYIPVGTTDVIAHTKMIGGGETTVIEFTAPEAGTYNYICSFPGHFAMMKGKLMVE